MIYQGVDTAARITAETAKKLRQEDVSFAVRYLVPNFGATAWKALSASEAADIRSAGLALMLCWELTGDRVKGGGDVGKVDGAAARKLAEAMGVPAGTAIYFAADYNAPETDFRSIFEYLYGASQEIGAYSVGLYGHEDLVRYMADRKACRFFWQCVAWSNQFDAAATVRQYCWQGGDEAKALTAKVGIAVDLDSAETLAGMWLPDKPSTEAEDAHKWATDAGIVDETMRDVSQFEIMLWRYHRIFTPEDNKTASGLLE